MESWGWRLPFLLAAPLGLMVSTFDASEDSPVFREMSQKMRSLSPVWALFQDHWRVDTRNSRCVTQCRWVLRDLAYMPTYLSQTIIDPTLANITTTVSWSPTSDLSSDRLPLGSLRTANHFDGCVHIIYCLPPCLYAAGYTKHPCHLVRASASQGDVDAQ